MYIACHDIVYFTRSFLSFTHWDDIFFMLPRPRQGVKKKLPLQTLGTQIVPGPMSSWINGSISRWWFGTFFHMYICIYIYIWIYIYIYIHILGIVIPTDFHIFQRGGSTTNQFVTSTIDRRWAWKVPLMISMGCLKPKLHGTPFQRPLGMQWLRRSWVEVSMCVNCGWHPLVMTNITIENGHL